MEEQMKRAKINCFTFFSVNRSLYFIQRIRSIHAAEKAPPNTSRDNKQLVHF